MVTRVIYSFCSLGMLCYFPAVKGSGNIRNTTLLQSNSFPVYFKYGTKLLCKFHATWELHLFVSPEVALWNQILSHFLIFSVKRSEGWSAWSDFNEWICRVITSFKGKQEKSETMQGFWRPDVFYLMSGWICLMIPKWQLLNVVPNFRNVEHLVALSSGNCWMYSTWEHCSTSCF